MTEKINLFLRMFEGDGGAGAAPAAGDGAGEAAEIPTGVLEDGTEVDDRLAARMKRQEEKRKARGQAPLYQGVKMAQGQQEEAAADAQAEEPAKGPEDRWNELKKGEFREQYGRDVAAAVQERFKNQQDASDQLAKLQPMLSALAKQHGVEEGDLEALSKSILDDDSLYEDEAEAAGMTVESYRTMKTLEEENARYKRQEEESLQQQNLMRHFQRLTEQAEAFKAQFPDFDLKTELQNKSFLRMTSPEGGLSVEEAYWAIHHREIGQQQMAYGVQRATQQISQTIQANRARPSEGALNGGQATNFQIDPKAMTPKQRQDLIRRASRGEKITF